MKTTITGLVFCLAFWGNPHESQGQIRDDDSSMIYLALHCGASAGISATNYEEYGAKLARTIGDLDVVQQERVFGYVPRPSGGSGSTLAGSAGALLTPQTTESLADSLLAGTSNTEGTATDLASTTEIEDGSQSVTTPVGDSTSSGSDPGSEGAEGGDQGGNNGLPRGYQNLPDWLTKVIEQFEARYQQ